MSLQRAVDIVRATPLAMIEAPGSWTERGYFAGPAECHELIETLCPGRSSIGMAFGQPWPFLEHKKHILAPALPVALPHDEVEGPDASYDRVEWGIRREAGGRRSAFLHFQNAPQDQSEPLDLLWFSDLERFVIAGDDLLISGLFVEFELPIETRVAGMLRKELPEQCHDVLAPITEKPEVLATASASRLRDLITGESWRDPARYLGRRLESSGIETDTDIITMNPQNTNPAAFRVSHDENGWSLDLSSGHFMYRRIALHTRAEYLVLEADVDPGIDLSRSDTRARIAFDLNGDLISL